MNGFGLTVNGTSTLVAHPLSFVPTSETEAESVGLDENLSPSIKAFHTKESAPRAIRFSESPWQRSVLPSTQITGEGRTVTGTSTLVEQPAVVPSTQTVILVFGTETNELEVEPSLHK